MSFDRALSVTGLLVGACALAACSIAGGNVKVRPVDTGTLTGSPYDRFYEGAVSAIKDRNYALALDYLQEARARTPRSVKVLNALGVVYDKLGRFDLSARYYAQAREIEPASRIVAENVGYSRVLQGLKAPETKLADASQDASNVMVTATASVPVEPALQAPIAAPTQPVIRAARNEVPIAPVSVPRVAAQVRAVPISAPFLWVRGFAKLQPPALPEAAPVKVAAPVSAKLEVQEKLGPLQKLAATGNPVTPQASKPPSSTVKARPLAKTVTIQPVKLTSLPASANPAARISPTVQTGKRVLTIGQPLQVVNASGKAGRAAVVSQRLKALGWTVKPSDLKQVRPETALLYSPANLTAAQALQRTLPFPVRLTRGTGPAMQLVIGRDHLSWKPRSAYLAALWQRGTVVASLQKPSTRGVR